MLQSRQPDKRQLSDINTEVTGAVVLFSSSLRRSSDLSVIPGRLQHVSGHVDEDRLRLVLPEIEKVEACSPSETETLEFKVQAERV